MIEILSSNELQKILEREKYVVLYGYSKSCTSCKKFDNVYLYLEGQSKYAAITFLRIDRIRVQTDIRFPGTPSFLFFKDGKQTSRMLGIDTLELSDKLDEMIEL